MLVSGSSVSTRNFSYTTCEVFCIWRENVVSYKILIPIFRDFFQDLPSPLNTSFKTFNTWAVYRSNERIYKVIALTDIPIKLRVEHLLDELSQQFVHFIDKGPTPRSCFSLYSILSSAGQFAHTPTRSMAFPQYLQILWWLRFLTPVHKCVIYGRW